MADPSIEELARLLPSLPTGLLTELWRDAKITTVDAGQTVVHRGSRFQAGMVSTGMLGLILRSADGRSVTVRYLGTGTPYGLVSLYEPMPGTLKAVRRSRLVTLQASHLLAASRQHPELCQFVNAEMVRSTVAVVNAAEEFAFMSVSQRVAVHLLRMAGEPVASGRQVARVTQQDLADAVGTAREVVARVLHEMSEAQVISLSRGEITISDAPRLAGWTEGEPRHRS